MDDPELKSLIERLNKNIEKSNSLWVNFLKGAVTGLGFFLGSVILVAILAYLFSLFNLNRVFENVINQIFFRK